MQITNNLIKKIQSDLTKITIDFMLEEGFDDVDEAKDYFVIEVEQQLEDQIKIEVRAELSYDGLWELKDKLDDYVMKYDNTAYFDFVDSGILESFVDIDTDSFNKIKEDYDGEKPEFEEYQLADALEVINDAIYKIDDNVNYKLAEVTGIKEARKQLYGAYAEIAKILKRDYPESKLYDKYMLAEA